MPLGHPPVAGLFSSAKGFPPTLLLLLEKWVILAGMESRSWGGLWSARGGRSTCSWQARAPMVLCFKFSLNSSFQRTRQLGALPLFSQLSESRACPASRLEKDMGTCSPYFKAGKKPFVKGRNKTCLVTCHFNENISLSQVSLPPPHLPFFLPSTWGSQAGARRKTEGKLCTFREHDDLMTNM